MPHRGIDRGHQSIMADAGEEEPIEAIDENEIAVDGSSDVDSQGVVSDEEASDAEEEEEDETGEGGDDTLGDDDSFDDDDDDSVLTVDVDFYDELALPPYACRYCGIHDPASVARCVETNKWFCNAVGAGGGGSHLVHHLVRSRSNQVQLHPESPLGDTVLECYNCASKNSFVLGFVPANASSVVVLLCRVCVETVPALKDMDWELSQWHPLVQDRKFLPWLVKVCFYIIFSYY